MNDKTDMPRIGTAAVAVLHNLPSRSPSKDALQRQREASATENVALLLGGFRKTEADDAEIFARALMHILARYDPDIQKEVTAPGRWQFPPSGYELRQACEAIANERARAKEREDNLRKQLEERRRLDALYITQKALPGSPSSK